MASDITSFRLEQRPDDDDIVSAGQVRKSEGGKSSAWLHRAIADKKFPEPDLWIAGRRYWTRRTLRLHRAKIEAQSRVERERVLQTQREAGARILKHAPEAA